jgi:predicted MFS family arabinose efflux permease
MGQVNASTSDEAVQFEPRRARAALTVVVAAQLLVYLLLTYYLQVVKDYSAFATGLAFVPIGIGIVVGSAAARRAVSRWQPRRVVIVGLLLAMVGVAAMALLRVDTPFWSLVLPVQLVLTVALLTASFGTRMRLR